MAVRKGKLISAAPSRGLNRNRTGLMSMVSKASICSEMRMMPISAAMAEPARATIMMAANTGPISRIRLKATRSQQPLGTELHQRVVTLQA